MRATATRGGKEVKPHTRNTVLRRREIRLADSEESTHASSSASTLGLVIPASEAAPLELDLTLDLQSQIEIDLVSNVEQPAPSIPARELIPSFRTPNIQYEVGDFSFYGVYEVLLTQAGLGLVPSHGYFVVCRG